MLETLLDFLLGLVAVSVLAITRVLWNHSKEIARLDATVTPENVVRDIVERETDRLHEDQKEFRAEMRQDMSTIFDRLEQIRKDLAKSRSTD